MLIYIWEQSGWEPVPFRTLEAVTTAIKREFDGAYLTKQRDNAWSVHLPGVHAPRSWVFAMHLD